MPKNDFQTMSDMANKGLEISCAPTLVSAQTAKGGGHVTMGVDQDWLMKVALQGQTYRPILYIVNINQFNAVKNETGERLVQSDPVEPGPKLCLIEYLNDGGWMSSYWDVLSWYHTAERGDCWNMTNTEPGSHVVYWQELPDKNIANQFSYNQK